MDNEVTFNRNIIKVGESMALTLPKELIEYLGLKAGCQVCLVGKEKTKGKFIALWKKEEGQEAEK